MSDSANSPIIFISNCVDDLNVIIFAVARLFKFQYVKRENNFMVLNINKTNLHSFNSAIHEINFTNKSFNNFFHFRSIYYHVTATSQRSI